MNCCFNEHNPKDHPCIIRVSNGKTVNFVVRSHCWTDEFVNIQRLRSMERYLTKVICRKNGVTYEAINLSPRELKLYINDGIIPEECYEKESNSYVLSYYENISKKVAATQIVKA